jgi:Ca2+-binding EF-hand superfamily protein
MQPWNLSVEAIKEYETIFQTLTENNTKTLPKRKLATMLRLCGASPTRQQIKTYEEKMNVNDFTFGDFLDVLTQHMDTPIERELDDLMYKFFALHDTNLGTIKEGFVSVDEIIKSLCKTGPDPVPMVKLRDFLNKNGLNESGFISISKFIQLFGYNNNNNNIDDELDGYGE